VKRDRPDPNEPTEMPVEPPTDPPLSEAATEFPDLPGDPQRDVATDYSDASGSAAGGAPVAAGTTAGGSPLLATDQLTGQRLLDRYVMGEKIGSGGFGAVYRATDDLKRSTGEASDIAIKIMDAKKLGDRLDVLIQEVSRSHLVTHPNILRVYDIHVDQGFAFITMELLNGQVLADRLNEKTTDIPSDRTQLPLEEVDRITSQVCAALDHCHEHQLVHADIKPDNIFLCSDGTVKVLDLGIAQLVGVRGNIAGFTRLYASPQQMSGDLADPKDDIFSVGCMLYLCLTGELPFEGRSSQEALDDEFEVDIAKLPRRYRRALSSALDYSRESRIESAAVLWKRVNPAIRRRNAVFAGLAVLSIAGFISANLLGQSAGLDAIAVSPADRASADELYQQGMSVRASDTSTARAAFVEAIQLNPYHDDAAEALVAIASAANYLDPTAFSLIWEDFASAIVAAPTSEPLLGLVRSETDRILSRDPSGLRRSRVLSEFRAPLCVLPKAGYRSEELENMRASLKIRC